MMADEPDPSGERAEASLKDAIRKLTEAPTAGPEDGVGPEGRDEPAEPDTRSPRSERA